jgi:hypothetical protein
MTNIESRRADLEAISLEINLPLPWVSVFGIFFVSD